ncbi:ATP-binding protein [Leptospira levettii]|uniref:ATP-binding protein n=1 Tax=Leptospira levettii TaxID=2023178 RepID=UPI001FAEEE1D|nr:DUF87 domain-containing protein [Leptospira levettii]
MQYYLTGIFGISGNGENIWIISLLGLQTYRLLSAPFFSKAVDAISLGITGFVSSATLDLNSSYNNFPSLIFLIHICTILSIILFFTGIYNAYSLKNEGFTKSKSITNRLIYFLSKPELIFSPLALYSIFGYYKSSENDTILLVSFWMLIIFFQPIENLILFLKYTFNIFKKDKEDLKVVGKLSRIDSPNIVRVILSAPIQWNSKHAKKTTLLDSNAGYILPLFYQNFNDKLIGTGIFFSDNFQEIVGEIPGYVYHSDNLPSPNEIIQKFIGSNVDGTLIGFIIEDSSIQEIKIEISSDSILEEGMILFCKISEKIVYYQIIEAKTKEEVFKENPYGSRVAKATQIGIEDNSGEYTWFPWLPEMNTPVFKFNYTKKAKKNNYFSLGNIPGTFKPVKFDFKSLAKFHTAILGITGMGKTEVVFDLIKEGLDKDTKIICFDLTGDYAQRLKSFKPSKIGLKDELPETTSQLLEDIETGEYSASKEKARFNQFFKECVSIVNKEVNHFLKSKVNLSIFELNDISNTRATLRITELYLSAIFQWAKKNRSKNKQILIVLEEAHTIAPEFNLYRNDRSDTDAVVGRISQIALQGRKYNVGLVVVSQRTALVSKTILSQCNTFITFKIIDKTSLEFLSQVYGQNQINLIPNLRPLHALVYGKGVKSDKPILISIPYVENKKTASEQMK